VGGPTGTSLIVGWGACDWGRRLVRPGAGVGLVLVRVGDGDGDALVGVGLGEKDSEGVGLGGAVVPQNGGTQVGCAAVGVDVGDCAEAIRTPSSTVAHVARTRAASSPAFTLRTPVDRDTSPPARTLLASRATHGRTCASDPA
jgi:hypothetical protein